MSLTRKLSALALLLTIASTGANAVVNEDYNVDYTTSRKFGRGVANVLTGVLEVPKGIYYENQESGWVGAYTTGFCDGIYNFVARECIGLYEVFTCFGTEKEPIITPEYVLGGPNGVVLDGYNKPFSIDNQPNNHSDHSTHSK